jgi:glycosyltransferase involved in cell wall biosynthesis
MSEYKSRSFKQIIGNAYRKFVLPLVIKKFKYIITVSEYSKSQIIRYFKLPESRIVVFPNSIKFDNSSILDNIEFINKSSYFFHIGGEPEHKNTLTVVKAFALLPKSVRDVYKLKILGIRDKYTLSFYYSLLSDLGLTNSIEFLPFITDYEIEYYFRNAKLFIFPSKEEGFGIPIIESMKYGCPLICSNTSCIPEIAGAAAYYFDPNSPSDLADKILELLDNHNDTERNILAGYEILNKYSYNSFKKNISEWSSFAFDY